MDKPAKIARQKGGITKGKSRKEKASSRTTVQQTVLNVIQNHKKKQTYELGNLLYCSITKVKSIQKVYNQVAH
jgi:hypothetical protein